jgi:uncharacterized protein with von Willebrand factor type A (vWA) domain
MTSCSPKDREYIRQGILLYWRKKKAAQMTTALGKSFAVTPDGKIKKRPPRMPPVLAAGQRHKADRQEKRLRENAAKARRKG